MTLHEKLEQAVMAVLPKNAPKPTFKAETHWSQDLPILRVNFGGISIPCGFNGRETDVDLTRYAGNIIKAYEAEK